MKRAISPLNNGYDHFLFDSPYGIKTENILKKFRHRFTSLAMIRGIYFEIDSTVCCWCRILLTWNIDNLNRMDLFRQNLQRGEPLASLWAVGRNENFTGIVWIFNFCFVNLKSSMFYICFAFCDSKFKNMLFKGILWDGVLFYLFRCLSK